VESSNLQTVQAMHQAFQDRDLEAFLPYLTEDVEWGIGAYLTGKAVYHGKEGVREWWRDLEALFIVEEEELRWEYLEDHELPDGRILSLGQGTIRRAAGDLETEFALLYTFREGKVSSVESFPSHAEARRELSLEG
jgi:ketosteroid isomerase-like protein